ncbi:GxxExxY protein [Verrucomicrobia bacterium]|nr:GxxExxY protein [Verrucomicrobiota bacterium]
MKENDMGTVVVDAALQIHRELGPGLLESVYEAILAYELRERGLYVERQVVVSMNYKGLNFDEGFRADLVIEKLVVMELKSVESMNNAHLKQLQTYLKLMNLRLGYLLNFGDALMKKGIRRVINGLK